MKWQPGELDQRITIKRETLTPDGMGGSSVALSTVATVWAKVIGKSGGESDAADRINASAVYTFVIRYRTDLKEKDRITWGGVDYNIRAIPGTGRRRMYLEIEAQRGVAM